jgi:surface antigen
MNNVSWCAIFVSYCFYNKGLPLPATTAKGFSYCGDGIDWFKNKGWWHITPQVGDVVFYNWPNTTEQFDHVGIVEKVYADSSIGTIEGNWDDRVTRMKRSDNIIGYGRPPYTDSVEIPGSIVHPLWQERYIILTSPPMQGNDVLLWQRQMIFRGWNLNADGMFKKSDHDILIQFQEQKGLETDGKIGPISWDMVWESPITPD